MMPSIWYGWKEDEDRKKIPDMGSEFIMDYIMIFELILELLIDYLEVVPDSNNSL